MTENIFIHTSSELADVTERVLSHARSLGASDAMVDVQESESLSVSVRNASLDAMENSRSKQVSVTVYVGNRRGDSATNDFSPAALKEACEAAFHLASNMAEDPWGGPVAQDEWARELPDLDLFHPWNLNALDAIKLACEIEAAATSVNAGMHSETVVKHGSGGSDERVASEASGVSRHHSQFHMATTQGFSGGYAFSSHALSCHAIASGDDGMRASGWSTDGRSIEQLLDPGEVGRIAAQRALSRLGATRLPTGCWPVLFESSVAMSLLSAVLGAIGGASQYRRESFLLNSLATRVLAPHVSIGEEPLKKCGRASAPFDADGVATRDRLLVSDGVVESYILAAYSARRLGLPLTGQAGGPRNVWMRSNETRAGDGFDVMVRRMGKGLIVTEMFGGTTNAITGDYSQGVAGFWVEGGEIRSPVEEITIAGNLPTMFAGIVAIGDDELTSGSFSVGSVLIDQMQIAGF